MRQDGTATLSVTVDFRSPERTPASVRITNLPEAVTAEPENVEWTARRGRRRGSSRRWQSQGGCGRS